MPHVHLFAFRMRVQIGQVRPWLVVERGFQLRGVSVGVLLHGDRGVPQLVARPQGGIAAIDEAGESRQTATASGREPGGGPGAPAAPVAGTGRPICRKNW